MSDFEERLGRALEYGAKDAPDVAGLAAAARRQANVRRRRAGVLGVAAVVVTIAVPAAVLLGGGPDAVLQPVGPATQGSDMGTPTEHEGGWRVIEHDGVSVEVPGHWAELECDSGWVDVGPEDGCEQQVGVVFYGRELFDPAYPPGVVGSQDDIRWGGFVYAGEYAVWVVTQDAVLTRRILDSNAAGGVRTVATPAGVSVEIPDGWERAECGLGFETWGPPNRIDDEGCVSEGIGFLDDTFQPAEDMEQGGIYQRATDAGGRVLWGGYVWLPNGALLAVAEDPHLVGRILESASWPEEMIDRS